MITRLNKWITKAKYAMNLSIGLDMGSSNFRVWVQGRGISEDAAHVVAINARTRKVVAVGQDALAMYGKVPDTILIRRPFREGVMSRFGLSVSFFRYIFHQHLGKYFLFKPVVMISTASDSSSVERQALSDALFKVGARQVFLIDSPLAAAIGAGIPVAQSSGNIVVHLGGGVSEMCVLSLGSIVMSKSVRIGGEEIDRQIVRKVREKYAISISREVATYLKEHLLDLRRATQKKTTKVTGKDIETGYPRDVVIESSEIVDAVAMPLKELTAIVQELLEEIPAELAGDVVDKGIMLTGGGANLKGLDYCLKQIIGVPVSVAEEPELCVIKGVGVALENLDLYKQSLAFELQEN